MFIPIIMTLDPTAEASFMWAFHKLASIGKGYKWPVVAQKEYFDIYKIFEVPDSFSELYDVPLDTEGVLENIIPVEIPEHIINNYRQQFPSRTDAYVNSFVDKWTELVEYLYERLSSIILKEGKTVEGLILFRYYRCFEDLAHKLNVPTFYFELGLRVPDYRNTFYWSKSGLQGKAGFESRFAKFNIEFTEKPVLVLESKEILALFLREDKLSYLNTHIPKEYEFGILGGYSIPQASSAFNQITLAEELMLVRKWYSNDKIIIKKHPGDPLDGTPHFPNIEKIGITSAQFIQKCKRVVTAGSNVTFEAALYGVPAYDLGWSQYSFISNSSLKELTDELPDNIKLNFIAFCCLAPLELLKDINYIRKAITLNSELEMYKLNLDYYLRDYGLTYEELAASDNRLELILQSRLNKEYLKVMPKGNLTPVAELQIELNHTLNKEKEHTKINSELFKEVECVKEKNKELNEELAQLKEKYSLLENESNLLQVNNKKNIDSLKELNNLNTIMNVKLKDAEQLCGEKEALYREVLESTSYKSKPFRKFTDLLKRKV